MPFEFDKRTKPWAAPPTQIVLHSTGSGNPLETFVGTLNKRRLAIHYFVDRDGECTQLTDLRNNAIHISGLSDIALGIEFQNPLYTGPLSLAEDRKHGKRRSQYQDVIDGRKVNFLSHTPEQVLACKNLVTTLTTMFGIPKLVPLESDGSLRKRRFQTLDKARAFHGVLGHVHWPPLKKGDNRRPVLNKLGETIPMKFDPGTDLLEAVRTM